MRSEKSNDGTEHILNFIDKYGVVDKDRHCSQKVNSTKSKKLSVRKRIVRMTIDLHGLTSDIAAANIRSAFEHSRRNGAKEMLIIHGSGFHSSPSQGPVLKNLVRDMLENELGSMISSYRAAAFKDGGDGATVVTLL
jgi:DNA-nicking Smr family endonuclease